MASNNASRLENGKITILCLHGYLQNASIMQKSVTRLFDTRACKEALDFAVPEGKLDCGFRDGATPDAPQQSAKGWWKLADKSLFNLPHQYEGADVVKKQLADFVASVGRPIDVVLGFSQGAVLATILLAGGFLPDCRLAILMSGSDVQDAALQPTPGSIEIPAIMVVGERDTLCTPDDSLKLASRFRQSKTIRHRYGHVIPSDTATRTALFHEIKNALK